MARNKSAKQVTATINKSGFQATKKFMSTDADAWKQMVETTLAHIEKVDFDLPTYASGLAATVRGHGGSHTMEKWLHPEVPTEQWKKGLPYLLDLEAMLKDALADRPLKDAKEYQKR